jgi:hypothetical protein
MKRKHPRHHHLFLLGCLIIIVAIVAALIYRHYTHKPTITEYIGAGLTTYSCSQPIRAKQGSVPTLPGMGDHGGNTLQGLVPADPAEANRYCRATGME